ncbi:hypothetical protein BGZ83_009747 [Gryganskiella cystojenkinii]|nr:hypothetical protein BGZ83_009747 [Gryganskiella cystojenkinii]
MRFFSRLQHSDSAASYLAPSGLTVSLHSKDGRARLFGPGTTIQGQVHLSLARSTPVPCRLKVVFACHQSLIQETACSDTATTVFEVEHILIQDELLNPCNRKHPLHFSIKLPLCNYPPSLECGVDGPSVRYSIHAELTLLKQRGDEKESSVRSPSVAVMYLPMVPTIFPHSIQNNNPMVTTQLSQSAQLGAINASVESTGAVCIGESVAMVLHVNNKSQSDLHNIYLSLVRSIYPTGKPSLHSTVHTTTIPIAKSSNKNSTWSQQLQFRLPINIGLVPSIDSTVMPMCQIEYSLCIYIPLVQKHGSIVSRLRKRPTLDFTAFSSHSSSKDPAVLANQEQSVADATNQRPGFSSPAGHASSSLNFPPIPIIVGSLPSHQTNNGRRMFKWPIPTYKDVQDKPTFVRDRFEEEMLQHLSSLESLVVDDDDDELDIIDGLVRAAQRRMSKLSLSASETDEEIEQDESRIPARFRSPVVATRYKRQSETKSGLRTPPSSPPQEAPLTDSMDWISPNASASRRPQQELQHLSKARGLGRDMLLTKYQQKTQLQPLPPQQQHRPQELQPGLNIHFPVDHDTGSNADDDSDVDDTKEREVITCHELYKDDAAEADEDDGEEEAGK